jgi:pectate lyase
MMCRLRRPSAGTSLGFLALTALLVALGCSAEQSSGEGDGNGATGGASGVGGNAGVGTSGSAGATSGTGQGGSPIGGAGPTGGVSTGGISTGGMPTGGAGAGGSSGASTGGVGGMPTGGSDAGGRAAGGAGAGGSPTGGAGTGGAAGCMTPPAASAIVGWATQGSGTTGGGSATPMVVTTAAAFMSAIAGTNAAVVHLNGNIMGTFSVNSNKTIIGVCGASITGAINMDGSQNVIFRNLKVVGPNCTDSPQSCSGGEDAIGVNGGSHHIFFDHLDVSNGSDGNLDMTEGSDFITISWTKFSYSSMRTDPVSGTDGHRFSNLIGGSDTDPADVGKLNITFHHNWWADNVNQRMPRTRRGNIHVFNNLYTPVGNLYCTNAGQDAKLLVERNIYIGVNRPLEVVANGNMRSFENVFMNTMGNTTASGTGFTPTYTYTAEPTAGLEAAIRAGVGPK